MSKVSLSSVIRPHIEPPRDRLRAHHVDECLRVGDTDHLDYGIHVVTVDDGVEHAALRLMVCADHVHLRRAVHRHFIDDHCERLRHIRHDEEGVLFVTLVTVIQDLCGHELEDHRIESAVPAEEEAVADKDAYVEHQDIIPRVKAEPFRKEDCDEIRSAARRPRVQAQRNRHAVDQPAEHCDKQRILRNRPCRNHVRQYRDQNNCDAGIDGKFLADLLIGKDGREKIQADIQCTVRNGNARELSGDADDKKRKSRKAARQQSARIDKRPQVDRIKRAAQDAEQYPS